MKKLVIIIFFCFLNNYYPLFGQAGKTPLIINEMVRASHADDCLMIKRNYNCPISKNNEYIGYLNIDYFTDSLRKTLYRVERVDSMSKRDLCNYYVLNYANNCLVSSEAWSVRKGKVLFYEVSYYLNGEMVFPERRTKKNKKRENLILMSNEYLDVLIGDQYPERRCNRTEKN